MKPDPKNIESTARTERPIPLMTAREAKIVAALAALLAALYLTLGISDWTVSGNVVLRASGEELFAVAQITETDIALVAVGQPAQVQLRAYPGTAIPAHVTAIGQEATRDDVSGRVAVSVTLRVVPPDEIVLRDGFTGTAEIVVARDRAGLVLWGRLSRYLLQRF